VNRSRILIIEDEPTIADNLVYALETEGFVVDWVATGRAGLARVAGGPAPDLSQPAADPDPRETAAPEGPPDLVILDIGLPDMSGFDVCRAIRARCLIPILFLTARAGEVDQVVGLELGGDDYVVKPFSPRALTARVRALLRRCGAKPDLADGPVANAGTDPNGDFVIDADARAIRFKGRDLGLTRYEYGLFKLMLEHPNRVYSREQLLQLVWEHPDECFDRTIDTHIKTLRAKIRQLDPRRDPIRTRRGEGYAYEP